ncbi:MAG: hypothetical protein BGO67_02790 [Alphaproteobacteria bacterium 41-28]|nr:MAG: hypothetical protein BGO67_02790 [Alphaproteobacteria bacterium 41-28]
MSFSLIFSCLILGSITASYSMMNEQEDKSSNRATGKKLVSQNEMENLTKELESSHISTPSPSNNEKKAIEPPQSHSNQLANSQPENLYLYRIFNHNINNGNYNAVYYTQQLAINGKIFNLNRWSTKNKIKYVSEASKTDYGKTHLLAQGICTSAATRWETNFTTALISKSLSEGDQVSHLDKEVDWVSHGSMAKSNESYYIRKSVNFGGHAESQLISDLEDTFNKSSDAIVKLFMPPSYNEDNIYMCGLELFGPYDMCDAYNNEGNNRYDCVGQLQRFRGKHQQDGQEGQRSISCAIMDKLKGRFKGKQEDAFVIIYHSELPYDSVYTYYAYNGSGQGVCNLQYRYNAGFFPSPVFSLKTPSILLQNTILPIVPRHLYGYIHHW